MSNRGNIRFKRHATAAVKNRPSAADVQRHILDFSCESDLEEETCWS